MNVIIRDGGKIHMAVGGKTLCGLDASANAGTYAAATCVRCQAIEDRARRMDESARFTMERRAAELTAETGVLHRWDAVEGAMVQGFPEPKGFRVQGRRGGEWGDVPGGWYGAANLGDAYRRADALALGVPDSEFRVWDEIQAGVVYEASRDLLPPPVPSGTGWPGPGMVMGVAEFGQREARRYRRVKGTRQARRQCRGGWKL